MQEEVGSGPGPGATALTRTEARWFLLRYGGPLALVPSLLQPFVILLAAIALAAAIRQPWPLLLPVVGLAIPVWLHRDSSAVVDEQDEPELHAFVRQIARALGSRPPDRVVLDPSPNAGFRRSRATRRTELRLGIPLLVGLDDDALAAVIAHELAHGLQGRRGFGDADLVARLVQARRRVTSSMATDRRRPMTRSYDRLARFLAATRPLARAMETDADRAAIAVVGPAAMEAALRSSDRVDAALALYQGFVVNPLVAGGARPRSMLEGFTRWIGHADTRILDRLAGWHDADAGTEHDDHPLDRDRTTPGHDHDYGARDDLDDDDGVGDSDGDGASDRDGKGTDATPPRPADVEQAVGRHPSTHASEVSAVRLHDVRHAEQLLAATLLGRQRDLQIVGGPHASDDSAIVAWRAGATRLRLRLLKVGKRGRRPPALADVAAQLTAAGAVPDESSQLITLLVALSVAFAVELADRGWLGPLPGTSTLISPADTFDDAIELAMQAIEDHAGLTPLADALRAGRPRLSSTN